MNAIYEVVGLQDVRLFQKSVLLDLDALLSNANVAIGMDSQAEARLTAPDQILATARFRTRSLDDEGRTLNVSCAYRLAYTFVRDEPPTNEEITQLCGGTVLFNAWPFWRQEVAATFASAGIPFPVVPSLRPDLSLFQPGIQQAGETTED